MTTTTHPAEINNGVTTSWIPLTTGGPASAGCSSQMYLVPGLPGKIIAFDPWQGLNIPFAMQCVPAEIVQSYTQTTTGSMRYSLGPFQCPNDFTTATTTAINSLSTSVLCCPSDYRLSSSGSTYQQCMSTLTGESVVPKSLVVSGTSWVSWTDTTISASGATILANSVVGYVFATATSSSTGTITPINTQIAATTSAHPTQIAEAYKHGLHTGAKVGVAIGCVAAVLAVIALFIICSPRYRRRQRAGSPPPVYEADGAPAFRELGDTEVGKVENLQDGYHAVGGMENNNRLEPHLVHEMDGQSPTQTARS